MVLSTLACAAATGRKLMWCKLRKSSQCSACLSTHTLEFWNASVLTGNVNIMKKGKNARSSWILNSADANMPHLSGYEHQALPDNIFHLSAAETPCWHSQVTRSDHHAAVFLSPKNTNHNTALPSAIAHLPLSLSWNRDTASLPSALSQMKSFSKESGYKRRRKGRTVEDNGRNRAFKRPKSK